MHGLLWWLNAGDTRDLDSIPGLENPLGRKWHPIVLLTGNPMDRGASPATVHGITEEVECDLATKQYFHIQQFRGENSIIV